MLKIVRLFFILNFCFLTSAVAISDITFPKNDSAKSSISLSGLFYSQSNAFTNTFSRNFIFLPTFITPELKDEVSSRLKQNNRYGLSLSYAVEYFQQSKRKDIGYYVSVTGKEYFNAGFSDDFFRLTLYGNKQFEGDTANFDGLRINNIRFQKYSVGVLWTAVDTTAKLGFGLSYLNGDKNYAIHAERARLYTAPAGEYLNFETTMSLSMSDTLNKKRLANNGFGFATDMYFEAPFKTFKKRKGKVIVSVQDVGFIKWNNKAIEYTADSTYYFDGIDVNNIFRLRDSLLSSLSPDSVINRNLTKSSKGITTLIPASLNLYTITNYGAKFQFVKGVHYLFNANYRLLMYAKANFLFRNNFTLSTGISYGGYTSFGGNLTLDKTFKSGLNIRLHTSNIEGLILPNKTTAQSVYVSLTKFFF